MAALRGTHAPAGSSASSARAAVGAVTLPIWPGITTGFNARCQCTWAAHGGTYQVKYANAMCAVTGHRATGR